MKLTVTVEIDEENCELCPFSNGLFCTLFQKVLQQDGDKFKPCKECLKERKRNDKQRLSKNVNR